MRRSIQAILVVFLLLGAMALGSHQAVAQYDPDGDPVLCTCTLNEIIYDSDDTVTEVHTLDRYTYFSPPGNCLEHVLMPLEEGDLEPGGTTRLKYTRCEALTSTAEPSSCPGGPCGGVDSASCVALCPFPFKLWCCG